MLTPWQGCKRHPALAVAGAISKAPEWYDLGTLLADVREMGMDSEYDPEEICLTIVAVLHTRSGSSIGEMPGMF